jgi:RimJ/RimL family protein N-acetyltransferase
MIYTIRREEIPAAVLALDEICFPGDYRITTEGALWWVVWCGEQPVGYAGLRPCMADVNRGIGFFNRAGVVAEHRGNGLQKRLIRAREAGARALGLREVVTYVASWNCASINSLIACGYKTYSPAVKWAGRSVYLFKSLKQDSRNKKRKGKK